MALAILINGQDVTAYTDLTTIQIQEDVVNNQWEADVSLLIPRQAIPVPPTNVEIQILNGGAVEFAGVIGTIRETLETPDTFRYDLTCGSYQLWFNRHLVAEFYPEQPADAIVRAIVQAYCPDFTTNHVEAAPVVPAQAIDYQTPTAAIQQLTNMLTWGFYIDYQRDVHFYLVESIPSPLPSNTLQADTDLLDYGDLVLEQDGTQVKNRIIAKGFEIASQTPVSVYITCDGQNTTYPLPQKPAGTSKKYVQLYGGGAPSSGWAIASDVAAGLPSDPQKQNYTAYINVDNATVRFDPTPPAGAVVTGQLYYKYQPVYVQDDPVAIQAQAAVEGTDGIYEHAVQDPLLSSDDTTLAQAQAAYLLAKYGTPLWTGTLVSYVPGWHAGQYFWLVSATRWGGAFAPGRRMYVAQVRKQIVNHPLNGTPTLQTTVTFADRPYLS